MDVNLNEDKKSFGFALLGFFLPIVGLVLYIVWKDTMPLKASSAGKGALVSAIVSAVLLVLYVLTIIILALGMKGMLG